MVKLDFVGVNGNVRPRGEEPTPAIVSYFKGPTETWNVGLPVYTSLIYENLWPGIDLVYTGTSGQLKYTFLVEPGGDPSQIQLSYRGAEVAVNEAGQLEAFTPAGSFRDDKPYAYQVVDGKRVVIPAAYALEADGGDDARLYGFELGPYDPTWALVLDPVLLVYAGYLGGSGAEFGADIAVDGAGNAYVTGRTSSSEATFPVTAGPDLTFNSGSDASDVFVAKVRADGTGLVYAGYIGGSGEDSGFGIAVDRVGNAYVTGRTDSSDFPVTAGPDLTFNGRTDAFVAKLNADGRRLDYAGYIGGAIDDWGSDITIDTAGRAYVTGSTNSPESSFPVMTGPRLTFNQRFDFRDAFVAKVKADGTGLVYAGYIGGTENEFGRGIAVDSDGAAYVTGSTGSSEETFPVTLGPDLTFNSSTGDAFVAKVKADGTGLVYAGYIGGSSGAGIAVDSAGNAYVTGFTNSADETFPATVGPDLLSSRNPFGDAFVAKVKADGTGLVYAGYIDGRGSEFGRDIIVDSNGNAYVTGSTSSTEVTFPVTGGPDLTFNGGAVALLFGDAFVAKVKADGTGLGYAGYIGGSANDLGSGIAIDSAGAIYVTGSTESTAETFPARLGPGPTFNGGGSGSFAVDGDAFVAKIVEFPAAAGVVTTVSAASFETTVAPESIASVFGELFGVPTVVPDSLPLPTEIAGVKVRIVDSRGVEHPVSLFFASPSQINYLIPAGAQTGPATVNVAIGDFIVGTGRVWINRIAPGLFSANASGQGVAAALYLRIAVDGTRTQKPVFDPNTRSGVRINLGSEGDEVFLLLFGTGIRGFSSQITATVGGENVAVLGALPQGEFVGLDQVNIGPLPRSLAGRREVDIILTADGKQANTVTVNIE